MLKRILTLLTIAALLGTFAYIYILKNGSVVDTASVKSPFIDSYDDHPEISINYLKSLNIDSKAPTIEQTLAPGSNYQRYIASYISDGNRIYGLLTVPNEGPPEGGYNAVVFNHGYIPPNQYVTTEKYIAYVDYLAKSGLVVFKIDMRGHGNSEGNPVGSYFSAGYTIDAISALKSLQKLDYINPDRIGMWGHSMAGNLVLRATLVEDEIYAGVIWAGAVYSYEDFAKYRLNDSSYVRREPDPNDPHYDARDLGIRMSSQVQELRENPENVDFNNEFWSSISLTQNIDKLKAPIQIHHSIDDTTVNIGYSRDLAKVLEESGREYEFYEYSGGGHNINSPYFEEAMQRTVDLFKETM